MTTLRSLCPLVALSLLACSSSGKSSFAPAEDAGSGTTAGAAGASGGGGLSSGGAGAGGDAAGGSASGAAGNAGAPGTSGAAGASNAGAAGAAGSASGAAGAAGSASGAAGASGAGTSGAAGASGAGTSGAAGASGAGAGGAAGASGAAGSGGTTQQPYKGVANSPCADRQALNVSWYYNWEQTPHEPCSDGTGGEFVPMVWGNPGSEQSASGIQSAIATMVGKGYQHVLGFNEPDNTGQSNISVATAISLLPAFNNPSILVGTPASQANSSGQTWFKDYMMQVNASTTLRADFIAIHWYGWNAGSCDAKASQLESYIKYAEGFAGNRPIWLTEWGCLNMSAPDMATTASFLTGAIAMLAKHPRVQRYSFYPWATNCHLVESGVLTDLGKVYAAAPATK